MSFGHQASAEPPCKRACLVAPKGSVANNPFRMLTPEIMDTIKAMKSDRHPTTPSATAIKEAGLRCEWVGEYLAAHVRPRYGAYFVEPDEVDERRVMHGTPTCYLTFRVRPEGRRNRALGVVRTRMWILLRHNHSFEYTIDFLSRITNGHPELF